MEKERALNEESLGSAGLLNELCNKCIKRYNDPETQDPEYLELVGRVIRRHSNNPNLDGASLIDSLDENTPTFDPQLDLLSFFGEVLSDLGNREKMLCAEKQVEEAFCSNISEKLAKVRKSFVRIDDNTNCLFCKKAVDNIISYVYPNAVLCDHSCTSIKQKASTCPLTLQDFRLSNKLL